MTIRDAMAKFRATNDPEMTKFLLDAYEANRRLAARWHTIRTVKREVVVAAYEARYVELEPDTSPDEFPRVCLTLDGHVVAKDLKEQYR